MVLKKETTKPKPSRWGLWRRRECLLPTRRGWLLILLVVLGVGTVLVRNAHPFLAVTKLVTGDVLVVEGWSPDQVMAESMAEFKRHPYRKLYVTGGPLEKGAPLSEYKTWAEFGAATLVRMGFDTNLVQAVPAPSVLQNRTYTSAVALRDWLREHGGLPANLNVLTTGPHARRTRLLFAKAMGKDTHVGIMGVPALDYDPNHWWRSSSGVRTVIGETLAYFYVRLFFWPQENPSPNPPNRS